jgi:hypothetical protein
MKNVSRRDPANALLVILNLVLFSAALVGTILAYVQPEVWSKLMVLPNIPPEILGDPRFQLAAPVLLVLSFLYFLVGYVFHPGQGKVRGLYVLEGSGGPWMYAFDAVAVHEFDPYYDINPKIDYLKERFQVVNLKRGRVTWRKSLKSKRGSRLTFSGLKADRAYFKSRNLGPHAVDLGTGRVLFGSPSKAEELEAVPADETWMDEKMEKEGGDQTAKRVRRFKLPTGEVVDLKGEGDGKELWVDGTRRGKGIYAAAALYHNDAPGMRPAFLENPRSVIVGHSKRIGGRKNWCLTRVNLATGEDLWTLEERRLFPRKIKSGDGRARMQSLYAGKDVVLLVFTTPRNFEDAAFRIDARTGKPVWKYVF